MRTDFLKEKDFEALISAMPFHTATALKISLETGMRIGDVVSLPFEALNGTQITYTAQKTNKSGVTHISSETLADVLKITDGVYLFPSKNSKSGHLTRQAVWIALKKVVKTTPTMKNIAPHSARKTFAVNEMKRNGFASAQKALQHSRADTSLLYCLSDTELFDNSETKDMLFSIATRIVAIEKKLDNLCKYLCMPT